MNKQYQPEKEVYQGLQKTMKRPLGGYISAGSKKETSDIFDKRISKLKLLELVAGQHLFLLERNDKMILTFYHFSPGTGTRETSVDINKISLCEQLQIVLSWSPSEIVILVTPNHRSGGGITTIGKESNRLLRIGTDSKVYSLGDKRKATMVHLTVNGELVIQPTAIEVWEETLQGLDALATGESTEGGLYEGVVSNLSIVMLISGFESYTKKRFLEIEDEGIFPREDKVINAFYSSKERTADIIQNIKEEANEKSISVLRLMVSKSVINFQSFEKSKRAYSKAYNIQFGNLGVKSSSLEELKRFFNYRHKIIHVHPATGILNPEKAGKEDMIHSNKELIKTAKKLFNEFVKQLHQETLKLVPKK